MKSGTHIINAPLATQKKLIEMAKPQLHGGWIKNLAKKGIPEAKSREILNRMLELYDQFAPQSTFKDFWALYESEYKK